jgi:AcrR family transcriptional regulator
MADDEVKRRQYESPARAAAARRTHRRIRAAAEDLFTRNGYEGTSMRAVAAAAGVSERTVFLAFPTKAALLSECIRVAVRGGDEDTPLLDRPSFRAALDAPPERMLAAIAEASTALMARAARLLAVGEAAGVTDPVLEEHRRRGHEATLADAIAMAKALKRVGLLRKGLTVQRAADRIYALAASESVYLRLVEQRGWTDAAYARALEDALRGALVDIPA